MRKFQSDRKDGVATEAINIGADNETEVEALDPEYSNRWHKGGHKNISKA